jgi:polysaccharide biosynthesis protein PslG
LYVKLKEPGVGERHVGMPACGRLRRTAVGAAVAVLAFAAAAAVPAGGSADAPRDFWGVVPIIDLSQGEIDRMGAGNVGAVRQLVLWEQVEPRPNEFDWRYPDFLVANAAEQGIEILPFLYGTPSWVKGVDCRGLSKEECKRVPPLSPRARRQWAEFLRAIVGRYGSGGTFWSDTTDAYDPPYLPITAWQIWNEPSSKTYFQPHPDAGQYARLVKLSSRAIRAVDPEAEIVLAGVFTVPEGGPRYRVVPYLTELFRVRGIGKHFDIAAVHPYARTIPSLRKQIKNARGVMRRAGLSDRPLWITELGWSSDPPSSVGPLLVGEQGQRDLLEQAFEMLAARRVAWNLAGVFWYSWRDPGYGYSNCTFCPAAGLLEADGTPKPAWHAFVEITGGNPEVPTPPEPGPSEPLPEGPLAPPPGLP